jgi:hypothetical protein
MMVMGALDRARVAGERVTRAAACDMLSSIVREL